MTEQEVDRRCAIYGTILGVVVAGMIVALFVWAFKSVSAAVVQTDGSAPPVHLLTQERAWPPGAVVATKHDEIQVVDHWQDAVLLSSEPDTFRWVWHADAGGEACIFNVDIVETDGGPRHWANPGGGRDCGPENTLNSGNNCGYFTTGWTLVAAAGGSCASFGVPPCGGVGPCH